MNIEYLDQNCFFDTDLISSNPVFVEIGSYTGENGKRLLGRYENARLLIYEAGRRNYDLLVAAVSGLPITTHHKAVTGKDGTVTFYEFADAPSSNSTYKRHRKNKWLRVKNRLLRNRLVNKLVRVLRGITKRSRDPNARGKSAKYSMMFALNGKYKVTSVSVESVFTENSIDHIDVLFTNCEGGELAILSEILRKKKLRDKISQMCISPHDGRVYKKSKLDHIIAKSSRNFSVREGTTKYRSILLVNRRL